MSWGCPCVASSPGCPSWPAWSTCPLPGVWSGSESGPLSSLAPSNACCAAAAGSSEACPLSSTGASGSSLSSRPSIRGSSKTPGSFWAMLALLLRFLQPVVHEVDDLAVGRYLPLQAAHFEQVTKLGPREQAGRCPSPFVDVAGQNSPPLHHGEVGKRGNFTLRQLCHGSRPPSAAWGCCCVATSRARWASRACCWADISAIVWKTTFRSRSSLWTARTSKLSSHIVVSS